MPSWRPIQAGTAGLLHLMGLKNVGQNPASIMDEVRPSLEMSTWWLRATAEPLYYEITTPTNNGSFDAIISRERKWTYIHYFTARIEFQSLNAGDGIDFWIQRVAGNFERLYTSEFVPGITRSAGAPIASVQLRDLWIPPGFALRTNWYGTTGDTVSNGALMTTIQI